MSGEELPGGASLNPAIDGYAITADRNIVHTRATLNYHIEDPIAYIFNFASASNSIQNMLNNALLFTAARYNVDDILMRDVAEFQDAVEARVSDLTDREHLGIVIDPGQVLKASRRGNCRMSSPASPSRSKTKASRSTTRTPTATRPCSTPPRRRRPSPREAATASTNYVVAIQASANAFTNLLPAFEMNRYLFAQQKVAETMALVLTNVQDKIFLPERADGHSRELRLS